jgi:hypothetical protein
MVSFTYISGRGREGAALGGAEGACCEHDGFCEGGIGGGELGICGYGLEREKGWPGEIKGRELLGNRHGPHYDFAVRGLIW